ncbi:MAG: hypothetical protein ACJ74Z_18660 [Bryobacteraceae bacterium]
MFSVTFAAEEHWQADMELTWRGPKPCRPSTLLKFATRFSSAGLARDFREGKLLHRLHAASSLLIGQPRYGAQDWMGEQKHDDSAGPGVLFAVLPIGGHPRTVRPNSHRHIIVNPTTGAGWNAFTRGGFEGPRLPRATARPGSGGRCRCGATGWPVLLVHPEAPQESLTARSGEAAMLLGWHGSVAIA